MFPEVNDAGCCSIMRHQCDCRLCNHFSTECVLNIEKALASHAANSYTAAFRSAARPNSATGLKQFPYMELLDSNVAEKDYCVRVIFQEWREARSMLILKARSMRADGPY
jgi:hypothetical protein